MHFWCLTEDEAIIKIDRATVKIDRIADPTAMNLSWHRCKILDSAPFASDGLLQGAVEGAQRFGVTVRPRPRTECARPAHTPRPPVHQSTPKFNHVGHGLN